MNKKPSLTPLQRKYIKYGFAVVAAALSLVLLVMPFAVEPTPVATENQGAAHPSAPNQFDIWQEKSDACGDMWQKSRPALLSWFTANSASDMLEYEIAFRHSNKYERCVAYFNSIHSDNTVTTDAIDTFYDPSRPTPVITTSIVDPAEETVLELVVSHGYNDLFHNIYLNGDHNIIRLYDADAKRMRETKIY